MNSENKKLHICLVDYEYPKETSIGGIATYQRLLALGLTELGHKVTVIAGAKDKNQDYYEDSIHVIRIIRKFPYKSLTDATSYRKKISDVIEKIDKKEKIDIIESPEISAELIYYQRKRKIPIVIKLHTSYTIWRNFNKDLQIFPEEIEKKLFSWENELLKNADKIICCSKLLKETMPKYHNIDKNRIEVIANPADFNSFYPTKNNHNSKKIIYCGSLEKRKGVYVLAHAIPIVLDKIPDAIFEFIGDSKIEKNNLSVKENLLNEIPIKYHKNLVFIGSKNNDELNKYYNEALIGVIPSLFDNFPYVALEELATELPIIASKNTGISEMIEHNKSGMLYKETNHKELAKMIIDLYLNKEKQKEIGKLGREIVIKKYSKEIICNQMLKIYNEVINEYKRK